MNQLMKCILAFSFPMIIACAGRPPEISNLPLTNEQQKLRKFRELEKSILKITCTAYYENYYYRPPALFVDTIHQETLLSEKNFTSNSVAATGLILYKDTRMAMLLSCQHVFEFQDTVRTYYIDRNRNITPFLSSKSVLVGKKILVFHKNSRSTKAQIISEDFDNDVALIITEPGDIVLTEKAYTGNFADANKLMMGQEVYMIGFPKGFLMMTRGLMSPSTNNRKFMVDAVFNQGFSGGVVVDYDPVKDMLSYVGMANSVAFSSEHVLVPKNGNVDMGLYKYTPYEDDIYVGELKLINYGLTFVLKSNIVIDFLEKNTNVMRNHNIYYRIHKSK